MADGDESAKTSSSDRDAQALRTALELEDTPETLIIGIVAARDLSQRLQIAEKYREKYGLDLKEDITKKLAGDFEHVVVPMFYDKITRDAYFLHQAVAGVGTDEKALVEILCTRSNSEINAIKKKYKSAYSKTLEEDIKGDTSGDFKSFLLHLLQARRDEGLETNADLAKTQAKSLYDAGENRWGTDEGAFIKILTSIGYPQIQALRHEYEKLSTKPLLEVIKSEFSGDLKNALMTVVEISCGMKEYFASRLEEALSGILTDRKTLIRVVITRETDLEDLKRIYGHTHEKSLYDTIKSRTEGDYSRMLLAMVGMGVHL